MNMDVDQKQNDAFMALEKKAIRVCSDVLDGQYDGASDDERIKINVAKSALSACAKNRQTLTAREAFRFSVAATIGDDKQIKKYVKASLPQVSKQITA
jgi:hypothetical protein|tara:strand:- start:7175 stop:7468 length:294 start_codon:yes stop_codon:yes gene_type:complete